MDQRWGHFSRKWFIRLVTLSMNWCLFDVYIKSHVFHEFFKNSVWIVCRATPPLTSCAWPLLKTTCLVKCQTVKCRPIRSRTYVNTIRVNSRSVFRTPIIKWIDVNIICIIWLSAVVRKGKRLSVVRALCGCLRRPSMRKRHQNMMRRLRTSWDPTENISKSGIKITSVQDTTFSNTILCNVSFGFQTPTALLLWTPVDNFSSDVFLVVIYCNFLDPFPSYLLETVLMFFSENKFFCDLLILCSKLLIIFGWRQELINIFVCLFFCCIWCQMNYFWILFILLIEVLVMFLVFIFWWKMFYR